MNSDSTDGVAGYTYGTPQAGPSPLGMSDLDLLKQAAGFTHEDEHYLQMAGQVLADQAEAMVDAWRSELGQHPHLAAYSAHSDGSPNPEYSAASKPRFIQWIIDTCNRPYDQAWLDYQEEIGLRHTRMKKNETDRAESPPHIPLRYLLAFTPVVLTTTRRFLIAGGHSAEDVDRMENAWIKAVLLHITLWTRPYVAPDNW